jgi:hypothetical protein
MNGPRPEVCGECWPLICPRLTYTTHCRAAGKRTQPAPTVVADCRIHQTQISLVDQSSRLQSLPRGLLGHLLPRQLPQFLVDQR